MGSNIRPDLLPNINQTAVRVVRIEFDRNPAGLHKSGLGERP